MNITVLRKDFIEEDVPIERIDPNVSDLLARPRELVLPSERIIGSPHLFGATSVI